MEDPRIDRDAWTALRSAAEAHPGALELAGPAGPPVSVMIPYTRTGVSYEPASEDATCPGGVFERDGAPPTFDYPPPSITRGDRCHSAGTVQRPRVGPDGADRKPFPLPATVERPPFDGHSEALAHHDAGDGR